LFLEVGVIIDLQNLKKELSTELQNELVDEIRKFYEEIAKLSKTPVNITQGACLITDKAAIILVCLL
jgi:SepF-like predicted cell division protein (DUF552 family)